MNDYLIFFGLGMVVGVLLSFQASLMLVASWRSKGCSSAKVPGQKPQEVPRVRGKHESEP